MTDTKTIGAETAEELYEVDNGDTVSGWTRIGTQHVRRSRWYDQHYLVLADADGDLWGFTYEIGLTEEQEMDWPWDDGNAIPLIRLHRHEIVTVEYRTQPAEEAA